jgi:hypothetical protein
LAAPRRAIAQRPAEAGRRLNACPTKGLHAEGELHSPGQAKACPTKAPR